MPSLPLVRIPAGTAVHRLGTGSLTPHASLLRFQRGWTINQSSIADAREGGGKAEGWAIVGDAEGRKFVVETLLSRYRLHPPTPSPGAFPYITHLLTPTSSSPDSLPPTSLRPVRHLAFARPPPSGEFTDFTARYGALQEEDRLTFRENLSALQPPPSPAEIERVARLMRITHLLDLPSVSFSSGQTRRGRIAAALLTRPVLLLLEDPMAGLDVQSRADVAGVLGELNAHGGIRVVLVLRGGKGKGDVPDWVDSVAEVREGEVWIGPKGDWEGRHLDEEGAARIEPAQGSGQAARIESKGEALVELNGVTVSYGEGTREVLKGIDWTLREGEKWHLQGSNGSGKTTLLSLILGHHPRSFSLPPTSLRLFSQPRRTIPTPTLRTLIGHTSPEIFAAFPRGMGLSALSAIGSGFEGVFSRRSLSVEQRDRVLSLIQFFAPFLVAPNSNPDGSASAAKAKTSFGPTVEAIALRPFAHFTPPQQALLLFLRALVGRPRVLVLDEPSQGVDEAMWARCVELLNKEWRERPEMCTVVVSHYEEEVPWGKGEGKVLRLIDGKGSVEE